MAPSKAKTKRPGSKNAGGRPSKEQAGLLEVRILDAATGLFLKDGYGATSIEAVAIRAGISKRTFYHRYDDKSALFSAVVHRLIERLKPAKHEGLFQGKNCEAMLLEIARVMLRAALTPQALALHRVITAEASRFPELVRAVQNEGSRDMAIKGIGGLLENESRAGRMQVSDTAFAAEQFMQLVMVVPQRHAMGIGAPMTDAELENWVKKSVDLFLHGCHASH